MNVLAFDTCLGAVSAAVRRRGPDGAMLLHEAYEARSAGHAERLMPMIAEVMAAAGLGFPQLDRIAVTVGPGGFTGVRVGIAAARGLALAAARPVVTATSLAVMAHGAREWLAAAGEPLGSRCLMVAVDARRGALYVQCFDAHATATGAAQLLTPAEAVHIPAGTEAVVVGSGAALVEAAAREAGKAVAARLPDLQPHARHLAALAERLQPVHPVTPLYLRQPDVRPQEAGSIARARP